LTAYPITSKYFRHQLFKCEGYNKKNKSDEKVSDPKNQHVSSTTISKEELRFINEMRKTSSQLNVLNKEQLQAGVNQNDKADLVAVANKIINIHVAMGNEKDAKKIEKLLNPYTKNTGISNSYANDLINLLVNESIPKILTSPPIALKTVASNVAFSN
jgi:hypothetical protein